MRTVATMIMTLALISTINAQNEPVTPSKPDQMLVMLEDSVGVRIGLAPEQFEGWRSLAVKYKEEHSLLKEGEGFELERKSWVLRRDQAVREFLTPEQFEKWKPLDPRAQDKAKPVQVDK